MLTFNRIVHESDVNLLPEGATIIKSVFESTYEQVSYIVQHDYEMIIYKDKDGVMRKGYFPKAEEPKTIDRIPGTHASCSFIETCKMCGVSTLDYFKEFFKAAIKREQTKVLLSVCRA